MLESLVANVPLSFHIFMLFATVTVLGAGGVAFSRNIVYAAFSLLAAFAGVVGLFGLMSADFLAVVQLMVYVGGILVLILFAVMLTNHINDIKHSNPSSNKIVGLLLFGGVLALLLSTALGYDWVTVETVAEFAPTTALIGESFLGRYLLPFEVAGLLLLAALLAAVVVARKEIRDLDQEETPAQASTGGQPS